MTPEEYVILFGEPPPTEQHATQPPPPPIQDSPPLPSNFSFAGDEFPPPPSIQAAAARPDRWRRLTRHLASPTSGPSPETPMLLRRRVLVPAAMVGTLLLINLAPDARETPTLVVSREAGPTSTVAEVQSAPAEIPRVIATPATNAVPTEVLGTVADREVEDAFRQLEEAVVVPEFVGFSDYDRDSYTGGGWPDSDGDCQSDRHEILIEESLSDAVLDDEGCRVVSGIWNDAYDGTTYTDAESVTVDHLVPLAAAHRAGAWTWDEQSKRAFATDISFAATHVAVGSGINQSKGDRGPEDWRPPLEQVWCRYATDWISVKHRWELAYTQAEVAALKEMLDTCE